MRKLLPASSLILALSSAACSSPVDRVCAAYNDTNCDGVPDVLGNAVFDSAGNWIQIDLDGDFISDGPGVDTTFNGMADAVLVDLDGDGRGDAVDRTGDGIVQPGDESDFYPGAQGGGTTGGTTASTTADPTTSATGDVTTTTTDASTTAATTATTDDSTTASTDSSTTATTDDSTTDSETSGSWFDDEDTNMGGGCLLDSGSAPSLNATATDQYYKREVSRSRVPYKFISNAWGDSWGSHSIKVATGWTAFQVDNYTFSGGTQNGVPAGYPALFCGQYSDDKITGCGFDSPKAISSINSLETGLKWSHPSGTGIYNVSYDVWLSTGGTNLSAYFMIWYKDPAGAQPAGQKTKSGVTVGSTPGTWDVIEGSVNGRPIVNYVRAENATTHELFFDMKEFFDHAAQNQINLHGSHVLGVAVGTEIWSGPSVNGLFFEDFCVSVK